MSKINFNEFAKKTIIALKEIEYDLKECDYSIEEWSAFLREELEGEYHAEEEEEAFFLLAQLKPERQPQQTISLVARCCRWV